MTLSEAARQYVVYLQALRLSKPRLDAYLRVLRNILWFYGKQKKLSTFDEPTVLQYVKLHDPFDCTQPNQERGEIFCSFTHWLMVNRLIPAWSNQRDVMSGWLDADEHEIPGNYGYSAL
jgi:hypothetical protein